MTLPVRSKSNLTRVQAELSLQPVLDPDEVEFQLRPVEREQFQYERDYESLFRLSVRTSSGHTYFYKASDLNLTPQEFRDFTAECASLSEKITDKYQQNYPDMSARVDIWNLEIIFTDEDGNETIEQLLEEDHPEVKEFRNLLIEKKILDENASFPTFYHGSRASEHLPQALDFPHYGSKLTEFAYKKTRIPKLSRKKGASVWNEVISDPKLKPLFRDYAKRKRIFQKMIYSEWMIHQIKIALLQEIENLKANKENVQDARNQQRITQQIKALEDAYTYIEGGDGKPGYLSLYSIFMQAIASEIPSDQKRELSDHMVREIENSSHIKRELNSSEKRFVNETFDPILFPSRYQTRQRHRRLEQLERTQKSIGFERTSNSFEEWIYQLSEIVYLGNDDFIGFEKGFNKFLARFKGAEFKRDQLASLLHNGSLIQKLAEDWNTDKTSSFSAYDREIKTNMQQVVRQLRANEEKNLVRAFLGIQNA